MNGKNTMTHETVVPIDKNDSTFVQKGALENPDVEIKY